METHRLTGQWSHGPSPQEFHRGPRIKDTVRYKDSAPFTPEEQEVLGQVLTLLRQAFPDIPFPGECMVLMSRQNDWITDVRLRLFDDEAWLRHCQQSTEKRSDAEQVPTAAE